MRLRLLWHNPNGTLAVVCLANPDPTKADLLAFRDKEIARGVRTLAEFAGIFDQDQFPDGRYRAAWRVSADAVIVKLDLARDIHYQRILKEALAKLAALNDAYVNALADGEVIRQQAILAARTDIKQLIATMPAEVASARSLDALDAARPAALDAPIP